MILYLLPRLMQYHQVLNKKEQVIPGLLLQLRQMFLSLLPTQICLKPPFSKPLDLPEQSAKYQLPSSTKPRDSNMKTTGAPARKLNKVI